MLDGIVDLVIGEITLPTPGGDWKAAMRMRDRAWNAIDSFVYGFTMQLQNFPVEPDEYASAAAGYLPMIPATQYPYMHEISQLVAQGTHDGRHDFSFGLELILEGLERRIARSGAGS